MTSSGAEGEGEVTTTKPEILQPHNLMQLLADAITYRSPISDVDVIFRCGADVNAPVNRGLRPLHYAVYVDHVDCVRLLIDRGADVNACDDIGYTPMHLCARKGNIESMRILIKEGATVDFLTEEEEEEGEGEQGKGKKREGEREKEREERERRRALGYMTIEPVNLAIENNHVDCLRLLLDHGARPDHQYFMGYEINLVPLEHLDCLSMLLDYGADPNVCNRCGISPLMRACRKQNLQAARVLLARGAKVDLQCPARFDRKTALHFAVSGGNAALVHLVLRHGASPGRPEAYKYAALHAAVACDRPDMCEMLIKRGAQVDERSDENMTPLMLACATRGLSQQRELVQLLLERGADVNAHSGYVTYTSPAYLTSLVEHLRHMEKDVSVAVVTLLIRYGAKVHFTGAATTTRVVNPHGVLHYLAHVKDRPDIYPLLLRAASPFPSSRSPSHPHQAIRGHLHLSEAQKAELLNATQGPPSLKHAVRLMLRERLGACLVQKVRSLPLPEIVQNYVLVA